ncbi:hypothetical protein [Sphingomonas sp.]|uniref:hypothetical protein n=1 Tax=Sphingomonas sp. TaxID=28214 RepID=UPI00286C47F6|nr:hypothetical protein [Sphingomonas sp.]
MGQAPLITGALAILWLACFYLLGLGLLILINRERAHRFLAAFAQTTRANWIESLLRMVVGIALVIAAPVLDHSALARLFGTFLAGTALLFVLLPGLHQRFAAPAVAWAAPFLPVLGVASIAMALMLGLYLA